jgi:N-acetylmuramoyl-L-alanine amidase
MDSTTTIDPGHGGHADAGRSSAIGVRGPRGLMEKEVTLAICGRVAAHLGARASLTRTRDVNLSLGERAALARRLGSRAFVSVHANNGDGRERGTEVWVHSRASERSLALADHVLREVARYGAPGSARLRRGDLAVLDPSLHLPDAGACLVEVDFLDHPEVEDRFADPEHIDALGLAIARGVARFLAPGLAAPTRSASRRRADRPLAWPGRMAHGLDLDLTDFDANQFSIIPDNATTRVPNNLMRAELETLKQAWGRMNAGTGLKLGGSGGLKSQFRAVLLDCMATSAVLRDAFLAITADDGHPVTLDLGRSQPWIIMDGFEWQASTNTKGRGLHTFDLDDLDQIPRVATTAHLNISTKTHYLIHGLVEAAHGVRSPFTNNDLRYWASHWTAIDEENRYRAEQGMQGIKGLGQPTIIAGGAEFHFRDAAGNDVEVETWHISDFTITSIDYAP